MRIAIGSDHAGYELKEHLKAFLTENAYTVVDVGAYDQTPSDYPDWAAAVGRAVTEGKADRGVVVCGSGVGASVAANKVAGVRAGLCHDSYSAHQGVEHDDMNVLVMGARVIGPALADELMRAYLGAKYTGEERHARRLGKIAALEATFGKKAGG
jgi:RpiB/LacA/LacB family sugar-phosphate isomerase